MALLTDKAAGTPALADLIHIVDVSDTTSNPLGTSKKVTLTQLSSLIGDVPTALSTGTVTATTYGITSDGGVDDVVLAAATGSLAGLLTATKFNEIVANNAKVTNATHTGEVTGATSLTIDKTAITGKTTVTGISGDFVLISDTSDSGNLKKVDVLDFLSGAADGNGIYDGSGTIPSLTIATLTDSFRFEGGPVTIKGGGIGASDIFLAENSAGTDRFWVRDNGHTFVENIIGIGVAPAAPYKFRLKSQGTATTATWAMWVQDSANNDMFIIKDNADVLAASRLGVGIPLGAAISGSLALHVGGNTQIEGSFTNDVAGSNSKFTTTGHSNTLFIEGSSGYVGIRTSNPAHKLHLDVDTTDDGFFITNGVTERARIQTTSSGTETGFNLFGSASKNIQFRTDSDSYINTTHGLSIGSTSTIFQFETSLDAKIGTGLGVGLDPASNAFLRVAASTSAKSQFRLEAGVAPTSPSNGGVWFDGTDLFLRAGGVTYTINKT